MHDSGATFHAPAARVRWFSDAICAVVPAADARLRVLDIGCGAGDQVFDLALRLPRAELVGVDIAGANVAAANARRPSHPAAGRIAFETADYLAFRPGEPFDVVFSYSVLQFVPGPTARLAARVADDTGSGGLFVNVMPFRCGYNRALALGRRALRAARSKATDALLMRAARALHGRTLGEALLAERIGYAYAVPDRFDEDLAAALEARGLVTVRREPVAHASPAQMKHALRVMRRR